MTDLSRLYRARFEQTGLAKRRTVWRVLCNNYFSRLISPDSTVLDLASGYGEFSNHIAARTVYAVDLNPDAAGYLDPSVIFRSGSALDLDQLPQSAFDVVFTSNFLEHFTSKDELDRLFAGVLGLLKPGGRFIVMGPNIRYAYREYWDYYDHHLPLSDRSLLEGLEMAGFQPVRVIDRFLPFTMRGKTPSAGWMVRAYLALPFVWPLLGKQFLVIVRKPG